MRIEVLFFAQLRDAFGREREEIEIAENGRVKDAVSILSGRTEWAAVTALPLRYAVNEAIVDEQHALRDGDRLVVLTPMSGG